MSDGKVQSKWSSAVISAVEKEQLRSWVLMHGFKNGSITARAYELAQESRSYLLTKGNVILTNGQEKDLFSIHGKLLRLVLEGGAAAGIVKFTGMQSKLRRIEGFWEHHLGADEPVEVGRPFPAVSRRHLARLERNYVVYAIKNVITGHVYFGSTGNVKERWCRHRSDLQRLTHCNVELNEEARVHGVDSYKFFVVSRFDTSAKMLDREQLLIAMYFNRYICHNLSPSVRPGVAVAWVPILLVDQLGEFRSQRFLTLHAAVRHYKLSKAVVRAAISAGHGRVGDLRFPVNLSLTAYRTYREGGRVPNVLWPSERKLRLQNMQMPKQKSRPKPSYYDRLKTILATQPVTFEELGRLLSAKTLTISLWNSLRPPSAPQTVLLNFIEAYGVEWIRRVSGMEISGHAINAFRIENQLAWCELDDVVGMRQGSTQELAGQEIVTKKPEKLVLGILMHYGLEPFIHINGPLRSAYDILGRFGIRW